MPYPCPFPTASPDKNQQDNLKCAKSYGCNNHRPGPSEALGSPDSNGKQSQDPEEVYGIQGQQQSAPKGRLVQQPFIFTHIDDTCHAKQGIRQVVEQRAPGSHAHTETDDGQYLVEKL